MPSTTATPAPDPRAIARTAIYCCGVRAADARTPRPVCGDTLAERFMDADAQATFAPFASLRGPNTANAARHRLIDDRLRGWLRSDPTLPVLLLGAGFDTRAFRLAGGQWLELDHPAILDAKERALPAADAPNPLRRVPIDFSRERLADRLAGLPGLDPQRPTAVVMEGVSMYLDDAAFGATAEALRRHLPRHTLICDLMDARFARRFGQPLRQRIVALGGDFAAPRPDPVASVEALGYRCVDRRSIAGRAAEHGSLPVPRWVLNTLLRTLRDGYQLCEFEPLK